MVEPANGSAVELTAKEAQAKQESESRQQCQAALAAREAMSADEKRQMDDLAAKLRPYVLCNHCKGLLLEPWLVKDCGHLFCFRCLHTLVYEQKATGCPSCVAGSGEAWTQDAFGTFKVVEDVNKWRKVGRDGSKFLFDDTTDSLIRMMWPERVDEYVRVDTEREQRRVEDLEARNHFEEGVHNDRLLNPSAANPGMAAGRPGGGRRDRPNKPGTRLRPPPMSLELPLVDIRLPRSTAERGDGAMGMVLLMPIQHCLHEDMRKWGQREGLLTEAFKLPALMKPYLHLPLERLSVGDLKALLAHLLASSEFWHDSLHLYPATEGLAADDLMFFVEWSQRGPKTPEYLMTEELIDDHEVDDVLPPDSGPFSLHALVAFLSENDVSTEPTLDLIYCRRPGAVRQR